MREPPNPKRSRFGANHKTGHRTGHGLFDEILKTMSPNGILSDTRLQASSKPAAYSAHFKETLTTMEVWILHC